MDRTTHDLINEDNSDIRALIARKYDDPDVFAEMRSYDQFPAYKHENGNGQTFEVIVNPGNYTGGGRYIMRKGQYYNKFTGAIPEQIKAKVRKWMNSEVKRLQNGLSQLSPDEAADQIAVFTNTVHERITKKLKKYN